MVGGDEVDSRLDGGPPAQLHGGIASKVVRLRQSVAVAFNREIEYPDYDALVAKIHSILDDGLVLRRETVDTVLIGLARLVEESFYAIRDVVARLRR